LADIGAYERQYNPDPFAIDSNLYGLDRKDDGTLYVADAGGNAVYSVDPDNGKITLLAVIPGIPFPEDMQPPPGGNPSRGGANELDPVPTGVDEDGGTVYVGLLSGAPFPAGAAKIVKISSDGGVSDFATGLTMVTDVKKGPDDKFYACQISANFLGAQPAPGSIVRINDDGTNEVVVPNLILPNGIAFDDDGNLFITVMAISAADSPPSGMVVRCDGIASS
jgi:DNA-binding beta-propeller fold protein YncE